MAASALALVFAGHAVSAQAAAPEIVRIDQPIVTQRTADYSNVRFRRGDTVDVQAGGCVQTGGSGKTWKRYVNPVGADADRFYHGLIYIPGALPTLARVADVIGKTMIVSTTPDPARPFLQLGYEDDNFSDNGYYGHDDGTNDQCKGVGDAYLTIAIRHASARARPPVSGAPLVVSSPPRSQPKDSSGSSSQAHPSSRDAKGFLETLPGIITALAALITAIATLIALFVRSNKPST